MSAVAEYQPLLTSNQVQDLRFAVEIAAQRGVQRYARRFAVLILTGALATGLTVHMLDIWLLAPQPLTIRACGGR